MHTFFRRIAYFLPPPLWECQSRFFIALIFFLAKQLTDFVIPFRFASLSFFSYFPWRKSTSISRLLLCCAKSPLLYLSGFLGFWFVPKSLLIFKDVVVPLHYGYAFNLRARDPLDAFGFSSCPRAFRIECLIFFSSQDLFARLPSPIPFGEPFLTYLWMLISPVFLFLF